jgi:hypothetical protein
MAVSKLSSPSMTAEDLPLLEHGLDYAEAYGKDIAAAILASQAESPGETQDAQDLVSLAQLQDEQDYLSERSLEVVEEPTVHAEGGLDPSSPALHEMVLHSMATQPLHWLAKGAAVASTLKKKPPPPPPPRHPFSWLTGGFFKKPPPPPPPRKPWYMG